MKRFTPQQLVIGLGVAIALFTIGSGLAPGLTGFEEESSIHREVFGNVPDALKVTFYTVIPALLVYGAVLFSFRVRNWQRGAPDDRSTNAGNIKRRLGDFRAGVYMQTLLRDPVAGVMHSLIYVGFLVLTAVTAVLEIDHQLPDDAKFLHGTTYQAYAFVGDAAGLVFLAGIAMAVVRRYVIRPYRIRIKSKPEHALILGLFAVLGLTGFAAEMFRIALNGRPAYEEWSFVGYPLSSLVDGMDALAGWHQAVWVLHVLCFMAFLAILPVTMLRHMFTSPMNMYLRDRERPKGAMKPLPNLMETELESFGASTVSEMTWKQLLDTDACTMCGRCTSVCPAHATGKPLDPREIVLKVGEVMAASGSPVVSPPIGVDAEITVGSDSLFERITPEELWACTSCKACDEICPVNIEILDKILDMRRYLSLMESNFPTELGNAYRSMENSSNPWGMSQGERADWAKGLEGTDAEIPVIDPGDAFDHEYLYWVGCAGSFDDKNRKVSQAMAKLMTRAGLDFAILGPVRAVHRRPGPPLGQRVPVPDAGHPERRGPQRDGGAQDHHPVPPLLQHAGQRVPPARRALRRRAPQPAAGDPDRDREAGPERGPPRGAARLPRLLLPGPPQRRVPGAPEGHRQPRWRRGGRGPPQRHQGDVLRRRRGPHVDGGAHRQAGERGTLPGAVRHGRQPHRHRLPLLLHHDR